MSYIKQMLSAQEELVILYQGHYGLPNYPLSKAELDSYQGQCLLRDFISALSEELVEFIALYESYCQEVRSNNPNPDMLAELQEECGDCLAFFMEILLYLDLVEQDVLGFMATLPDQPTLDESPETLDILLQYADYHLQSEGLSFNPITIFPIQNQNHFGLIGSRVSTESAAKIPIVALDVFKNIYLGQNTLKNKAWRKNPEPVDTSKLHSYVLGSFYCFVALTRLMGASSSALANCYLAKNEKNRNRIKNNY